MDYIQQEINMHKSKLLNLINNLINTQIIDNEIAINKLNNILEINIKYKTKKFNESTN